MLIHESKSLIIYFIVRSFIAILYYFYVTFYLIIFLDFKRGPYTSIIFFFLKNFDYDETYLPPKIYQDKLKANPKFPWGPSLFHFPIANRILLFKSDDGKHIVLRKSDDGKHIVLREFQRR
jgi:hypothetical protein